jgi:Dolichol kinase
VSIFSEIPTVWLQISLVGIWLGLILLVAEGLNRFTSVNPEVSRKVVHIGTGNVILLAWWLEIPGWVGITAGILAAAIAIISYQVPILPSLNSINRHSWGYFFLCCYYQHSRGLVLANTTSGIRCFGHFSDDVGGDGLAAVIGQKYGKHIYRVWGMKKSWEGSATMLFGEFLLLASFNFASGSR